MNNLYRVFEKSIGQNLDNDQDDIINVKTKLETLGYLKDDIKSGYITKDLNDSILAFQGDRRLKKDGVIQPGGPTEATVLGDVLGIKDDVNISQDRISMAPAIPTIIRHLPTIGHTGKKAWDAWKNWQKINPVERQDEIDELCDKQLEKDLFECSQISAGNGLTKKEAYEVCRKTAMERYSRCRTDQNEQKGPLYN